MNIDIEIYICAQGINNACVTSHVQHGQQQQQRRGRIRKERHTHTKRTELPTINVACKMLQLNKSDHTEDKRQNQKGVLAGILY